MSTEELGHLVVEDYKRNLGIDSDDFYKSQISYFKTLQSESLIKFTNNVEKYNNNFYKNGPNELWKALKDNLNLLQKDYLNNLDNEKKNELKELLLEIQNFSILSIILLDNNFLLQNQKNTTDWELNDLLFDSLYKKDQKDENCVIS